MSQSFRQTLARAVDTVLDPTIALSFDQTGFRRHAVNFVEGDLDVDLTGKIAVVTGANAGLGREVAAALARRHAQVWMLCRNRERGEAAREELGAETGGDLRLLLCDLSDLSSVDAAAQALPGRIDRLVHNAGVLLDERVLTADGLETTLATHLVGPFRLTCRLLPTLARTPQQDPSRIVWVSSGGMYPRRLSVSRLGRTEGRFDGVAAYADVKRAQVVLSELLATRLAGRGIRSNAMHPGWAATGGVATSLPTFHAITRRILRTPAEGADTITWLAVCERIAGESGRFWFDRRAVDTHLLPGTRESEAERAALWEAVVRWSQLEEAALP